MSMSVIPFGNHHGDTEVTERIDSHGESTGKTLSDLSASVFPLLKSAEFQHS